MKQAYQQYKDSEFLGAQAIQQAQTVMLQKHLGYAKKNSPAYQKLLADVQVGQFELAHLENLPLTEKKDIEKAPQSYLAVPKNQIADIVLSSGTTGEALQVFYTDNDLTRLAYNEEQSFAGCGIVPGDVALLTCTMDRCFVAGLAYYLGLRARGAAVIRNGHGIVESHAEIIRTMKPTVIVGVPTFLRKLAVAIEEKEQNLASCSVSKIICIGEPLRGRHFELLGIGAELESLWGAKVYSTYASTETITSFCECTSQRGGHLHPELAIIEMIDEKERVLAAGEVGEIVVTPMAVEGMPLIRYKTGDISFLETSPCSCGRFSVRLGPILGRKNQLMKVRGTSLFPEAVFSALEDIPEVSNFLIEVFSNSELSDRIVIHVSLLKDTMTKETLENVLVSKLRVKPEIILEADATLKNKIYASQSRKPMRFFDKR